MKVKRNPAQMTIDELKEVLKKSIKESKQGLGMTTDELRKRFPAQMTLYELKKVLQHSQEDFKEGRTMTTEELRKRHQL